MKCCDIHAGMLRTRVYIEKRARVDDGYGGVTETWAEDPAGGVLAAVQNLTGTERWEASRIHPGNLIRLTVRFRGDEAGAPYWQSGLHRVLIRNREYGILAIQDVEMLKRWIKMDVFEGKPT